MSFDFLLTSTSAWNGFNPCCCNYDTCGPPTLISQNRDNQACRSGFSPNFKDYPTSGSSQRPDAFDLRVANVHIPIYQSEVITFQQTRAGSRTLAAVSHDAEGEQNGQSQVTSTASFFGQSSTETRYNTLPHEMPASTRSAAGTCPPLSGISVSTPPSGIAVNFLPGTPAGWTVPKYTWNDNRPNDPTSESDPPTKIGTFNLNINGSIYNVTDPELTLQTGIPPNAGYCARVRIKLTIGDGSSAWSQDEWVRKSSALNPCCTETAQQPDFPDCNTGFATGHVQWSTFPIQRGRQLGIWRLTWSTGEESGSYSDYFGCSRQSGEDPEPGDDPNDDFQNPANLSIDPPSLSLNQTFNQTIEWTHDQYKNTVVRTSIYDLSQPPDPEAEGWAGTTNTQSFAATDIEIRKKDDDQNTSSVLSSLQTTASDKLIAFPQDERWGVTITGGIPGVLDGALARAVSWRPRTDGSGSSGAAAGAGNQIYAKIRQTRYAWEVPTGFSGIGNTYVVTWSVGRFSHRWVKWRGEFYEWMRNKYRFLHKPKPGDSNYPKRSDYPSGSTGDAMFAAAILAINNIEDPGDPPVEPEGHEPVVVSGPLTWEWSSDQNESPLVELDQCAPGYPRYPVEPQRSNYPPTQAGTDAYLAAHQSWQNNMNAIKARTARQSNWYLNTPGRYSLDMALPTPPNPLPSTPPPTQAQREQYNRNLAAYNNRMVWYREANQDDYVICDVTYGCGQTPSGPLMFSDTRFATSTLPVIDLETTNPEIYAEWFS